MCVAFNIIERYNKLEINFYLVPKHSPHLFKIFVTLFYTYDKFLIKYNVDLV